MDRLERAKKAVGYALIALAAVFLDQLTKFLAFAYLPEPRDYLTLIPGWLGLSHVENDAIAFGFGSGNQAFMVGVVIVTIVLMIAIPIVSLTVFRENRPARVALAVIEGGAIGNFLDRMLVKNAQGVAVVRDFVDLSRFGFANCNVADFCITLGAVAFIFIMLFIGPSAAFPLKKSWREEAKRREETHA